MALMTQIAAEQAETIRNIAMQEQAAAMLATNPWCNPQIAATLAATMVSGRITNVTSDGLLRVVVVVASLVCPGRMVPRPIGQLYSPKLRLLATLLE